MLYEYSVFHIIMFVEFISFIFMIGFLCGELYSEQCEKTTADQNITEKSKNSIILAQKNQIKTLNKELDYANYIIESLQNGTCENVVLSPYTFK